MKGVSIGRQGIPSSGPLLALWDSFSGLWSADSFSDCYQRRPKRDTQVVTITAGINWGTEWFTHLTRRNGRLGEETVGLFELTVPFVGFAVRVPEDNTTHPSVVSTQQHTTDLLAMRYRSHPRMILP